MFKVEDFVVLALVVFSLTVLFKDTDGPFRIFYKARDWLTFKKDGNVRTFFKELFACPWCMGTWISAVVALLYLLISHCSIAIAIAYWIASVGVTGLLYAMLYSFVSGDEE